MSHFFRSVVLGRPILSSSFVLALAFLALSQVGQLRLDASSDALLLQGDPDLAFYREVSSHYDTSEFLVLTWRPQMPLLSPDSLEPLGAMVDELTRVVGVASVTSVLDVPLLESPPLSLTDISRADALPTLRDSSVDRGLALRELTQSPIYKNLLVGEAGDVTTVQVSLERNQELEQLLSEREALRAAKVLQPLTPEQTTQLSTVEARYDQLLAQETALRRSLVADVRVVAQRFRPYAEIFVGGVPMIAADMLAFVESDLITFGFAIVGIMIVVLAAIFRDWRWVLAPVLNCALTAIMMLGLLAFLDWRMTVISSNFVAVLLIVTLSLSVHLVVRYRELEHAAPDIDRSTRAADAARLMLVPCLYTAATTIVAFASLMVAGIQPVIDFGMMMTVGIVVGFLCTFILVPALMAIMPEPTRALRTSADPTFTRFLALYVERFGAVVLVVSGGLAVLALFGISRLEVENRFIDYFKPSTEIYQGMELLDARLGGTIPLDIIFYPPAAKEDATAASDAMESLKADLVSEPFEGIDDDFMGDDPFADDPFGDDAFGSDVFGGEPDSTPSYWFTVQGRALLDRAHEIVDARSETGKVLSLSTAFKVMDGLYGAPLGAVEMALVQNSMPKDVNETLVLPYFSAQNDEARISVRAMETSKDLRRDQFLKELYATLINELNIEPEQLRFTSLLVLYNNVLQSLFSSQILTLGAVFLAIGLMFWVLFRSLSLALLALAPNLLAAAMVLGTMGLMGIPLDIMTITIAAIVVGIGVDDCIHYIHRFRVEFAKDADYHAAMHRSHASIGRAMYYTTVTVVIGFSLLMLSNFTPSLYFGALTVMAMVAAVAGALLLLPKLLLLFKPLGPAVVATHEMS